MFRNEIFSTSVHNIYYLIVALGIVVCLQHNLLTSQRNNDIITEPSLKRQIRQSTGGGGGQLVEAPG